MRRNEDRALHRLLWFRQVQPCADAELDHPSQEAHQFGALAGMKIAGMPRAEGNQAGRRMGADIEPEHRVGTHQLRTGAEDLRIADRFVAQHDMLVLAAQRAIDRAPAEELDAFVLRPLGGVVGELDTEANHIDLEQ